MTNNDRKRAHRSSGGMSPAWLPALAVGGWIAYSRHMVDHAAFLPNAISDAKVNFWESAGGGKVHYYSDQSAKGTPLVLVHSVNAAASAFEMRPLFEHYRRSRPVFALDLPGYGFSERVERPYSAVMYEGVIRDFLREVVAEPADVVALSLGSEFAARAALAEPELVRSLVLISPTGLNKNRTGHPTQQAQMRGESSRLHKVFSFPLWARAFFDLLTTRPILRYYLRKSFVGEIPPGFVDHAYATAHQPGAEIVPLRFISGLLFSPNVAESVYLNLTMPTLMLYDQDTYSRFDLLPQVLKGNTNWRAARIQPTLGLPHWEKPAETTAAMDGFWATVPARDPMV